MKRQGNALGVELTKELCGEISTIELAVQPQGNYRTSLGPSVAHLDREVVGAEGQVVPAAQRRVLRPHVHLEVLEKVVVLQNNKRPRHDQGK